MPIIDFHTHAFPDHIAPKAVPVLEKEADWKAVLDGTLTDLLRSMDCNGVDRSVVASIATKPSQFEPILNWCGQIASDRIVPLASVHPEDPDILEHVRAIHAAGLKGLKMHPYYQGYLFDEERMLPFYALLEELGLILLSHTGFDVAYPRDRVCDPVRIVSVMDRFPELKLVCSHLGAWMDWDEVENHMIGRPIYTDISFAISWIGPERARDFLLRHPADYILFGTDSPWADQGASITELHALKLPAELESKILGRNAERLLISR